MSPAELQLLYDVNGDRCLFNLYGDVNQHIEGTKGINDWNEFLKIVHFKTYELNENYRNVREVTEYCNQRFDMHMQAISIGNRKGVISCKSEDAFLANVSRRFRIAQGDSLKAIIIKDAEQARWFLDHFPQEKGLIHDMISAESDIDEKKWNLMCVKQAKGLEFGIVIALSGTMTRNEQYIAYTRALDQLLVYEGKISETGITKSTGHPKKSGATRTGHRKTRTVVINANKNLTVTDFFEDNGFRVIESLNRRSQRTLWVVGEKEELEPFAKIAQQKFGIEGAYTFSALTGYCNAWRTFTEQ